MTMAGKYSRSLASTENVGEGRHWFHWKRHSQPHDKCQQPRCRWPEMEAVVQVVVRTISSMLHMVALLLCMMQLFAYDLSNIPVYPAMVYCIVVNTVEILSLTVPAYTQSRQFYRLPSGLLCIVELGCVAFMMYSIKYLLREGFHGEGDCPQSTCVLPEERLGIVAYACEMINMVIHMEFSVMAFTHCAKRVVPRWLDYWDFERSHLASKRYQQLHHPQQFSQAPQSPRTTSPNAENSYELASMGGTRNTENGLETIVESSSPKKSSQEEYQN